MADGDGEIDSSLNKPATRNCQNHEVCEEGTSFSPRRAGISGGFSLNKPGQRVRAGVSQTGWPWASRWAIGFVESRGIRVAKDRIDAGVRQGGKCTHGHAFVKGRKWASVEDYGFLFSSVAGVEE
jgi:hypothetical protein